VGRDGGTIGQVEDLIVDTEAMKVRYLDITVTDASAAGSSRARIPAARVDLEPDDRMVVTDLSRAELSAFVGGEYTASGATDDVASPPSAYAAMTASDLSSDRGSEVASDRGSEVERLTRAEEELRIGTRDVQAGEVVIGKHVETERVTTPVQRRVEHVRVERRPVTGATSGTVELRDGEIRVPVMEEEVIVEKRPVVKEEIVVTREAAIETETVEAEVRREQVDISGDEQLIDRDGTTRTQRAGGGNRG
jgi:uncharacterized protein (TIGR02271 family)